jgi:hypothetical protein
MLRQSPNEITSRILLNAVHEAAHAVFAIYYGLGIPTEVAHINDGKTVTGYCKRQPTWYDVFLTAESLGHPLQPLTPKHWPSDALGNYHKTKQAACLAKIACRVAGGAAAMELVDPILAEKLYVDAVQEDAAGLAMSDVDYESALQDAFLFGDHEQRRQTIQIQHVQARALARSNLRKTILAVGDALIEHGILRTPDLEKLWFSNLPTEQVHWVYLTHGLPLK